MRSHLARLPLLLALVLAPACGDDSGPGTPDMKVDGPVSHLEGGTEAAPPAEAGADSTVDAKQPDLGKDAKAVDGKVDGPKTDGPLIDGPKTDAPVTDGPKTDAAKTDAAKTDAPKTDVKVGEGGPAPDGPAMVPEKVLYGIDTSSTYKYTLNEVMTNGTGQKVVSGPPAAFSLSALNLAVPNGPVDVRRDLPVRGYGSGEYWIDLPNKLGKLFKYYVGTTTYALAIARTNSSVEILDQAEYENRIAVSADGKLAAAVKDTNKIVLIKLDGTKWSSTNSALIDVTPSNWTVYSIFDESLVLGDKYLYFVVQDTSASSAVRSLYHVKLDGTSVASKINLPAVGGTAATTVDYFPAHSADRKTIAFVIGATTAKEDLLVIKEGASSINAVLVSDLADNLHSPGSAFMDELDPRVAISPQGTYVVFGTTSSASTTNKSKFWITKADGSGSLLEISTSANFVRSGSSTTDTDNYGGYHWVDESNLLFWAGKDMNAGDLFHYQMSPAALTNLTKTGTATVAPWDPGLLECDGAWVNPGATYIYYVAGQASAMNIIGVNLSTYAKVNVTTGLNIDSESALDLNMEGLAGSNSIWLVAPKANATVPIDDVYVFDQSTAGSLKNLTNHTGTSTVDVNDLLVSPDGARASYTTGTGINTVLWTVLTAGTAVPVALNGTSGSYVDSSYAWTSDSKYLVYSGGSVTASKLDLLLVPATGGTSSTIHAAQSYIFIFNVGK